MRPSPELVEQVRAVIERIRTGQTNSVDAALIEEFMDVVMTPDEKGEGGEDL